MSGESQAKVLDTGTASGRGETFDGGGPVGGSGMAAMTAITQRELASLFYSPIAYVVGFVFLFLTGCFFVAETLQPGSEASMRILFDRMAALLVIALPLLTMKSVAEEFATGSIETLMTAPVSDAQVIVAKFLGTLIFYAALLATTLVHVILLSVYADPIGSVVFGGYVGLILLGGMFIAAGVFASCCTRHQLLAALMAVLVLAVFTFAANYGAEYGGQLWLREVCSYLNVLGHFSDFSKGMIDSGSVIFFCSGTVFFLFLATKVLESRRWR